MSKIANDIRPKELSVQQMPNSLQQDNLALNRGSAGSRAK